MNMIGSTTPEQKLISTLMRDTQRRAAAGARDTAVMRVRDFSALMKIVAKYDLWDEFEAEMTAEGCTTFRIDAHPMRLASKTLWRKVRLGDVPDNTPGLLACGCTGSNKNDGDAGADAGDAGSSSSSGGVLKPGTSGKPEGSKDKPQ